MALALPAGRMMGDNQMLAEIFSEWGIIAILVVVVVLFGSTQLPKFARSLGSAHSEFKKGLAEGAKGADSTASDTEEKSSNTEKTAPSSIEQTTLSTSLEQKISRLEQKISSLEQNPSSPESAETKTE